MGELEVIYEVHQECLYVHLSLANVSFVLTVLLIIRQLRLHYYSESSPKQVLVTFSAVQGTYTP